MSAAPVDGTYNPTSLPDEKIPWLHLFENGGDGTIAQGDPKFIYISTLVRAEREMTSAREKFGTQMILPILAAFAILDQLGECYGFLETMAGEPPATAPIKRALYHFPLPSGALSEDEAHALYMMRNGLMHDAAYSSIERSGRKRHMIFRHDIVMNKVVVLPSRTWDGTAEDVSRDTITWFNPDLVVWIASTAIGRCQMALKYDDPAFVVRLPPRAIASRYLLWHRADQISRSAADAKADPFGAGRAGVRRGIRKQLTDAEVQWHDRRYHGDDE